MLFPPPILYNVWLAGSFLIKTTGGKGYIEFDVTPAPGVNYVNGSLDTDERF
jgi:hypothetical protein